MVNAFVLFFFFQAEDGIRDIGVTGVQTCALPISEPSRAGPPTMSPGASGSVPPCAGASPAPASPGSAVTDGASAEAGSSASPAERKSVGEGKRVDLGGRRIIKKKHKNRTTSDMS